LSVAIRVQPDKEFLITEERLRFPVDAAVPPNLVPFVIAGDLVKSIQIFERHRGWHLLDRVPKRKAFPGSVPCCDLIAKGKPGTALNPRFEPSLYQGDTDDAHNFQELSNPEFRLNVEGLIDWVAILHFWEPAVHVDRDHVKEASQALNPQQGFRRWEDMPKDAWIPTRKKFYGD